VQFHKKSLVRSNNESNKNYSNPVNFDDFNFRISYSKEEKMSEKDGIIKGIQENWQKSKKIFRYINRVSFIHSTLPLSVDISIVKSSTFNYSTSYPTPIPTFTIDESKVFENPEVYEIELEIDNLKIGPNTLINDSNLLIEKMKLAIKYVLMGLQETNYPVSYSELYLISKNYLTMLHKEEENYNYGRKITPSDFVGPNSFTLQMKNIVPINENMKEPNIRHHYTATDKADGNRCLLYVSSSGKIYLINTNMKIIFTGAKTEEKSLFHSLLDGEIIYHDKHGKFINLFAAFDIYFVSKKDVRSFAFVSEAGPAGEFRLPLLKKFIKLLNPVSVVKNEPCQIRIVSKEFYIGSSYGTNGIFNACNEILTRENNGEYEYNTDGIIFTPTNMGVGTDVIGKPSPNFKTTWEYSFKWKPPKFNTIDFLISTKKGDNGLDMVVPLFQEGINTQMDIQLNEYKTLILRCGFDEKKHGYLNPCQNVIEDKLPQFETGAKEDENKYQPVQFYPTNPYDPNAGICNIMLKKDETGAYQMITEENEVFYDNTIVEFRYELENDVCWRWIPLRVRYDKTAELRQGIKNFGNAYPVANSNWHSIHNPITEEMISTGINIPDEMANDDVYYNRISKSNTTRSLRDFHNLYVKKRLITSVAKPTQILIDYACGKAGDFSKWIEAKLSFVFGIDISKDNLENRLDGACARFLNYRKTFKSVPYALFVHGNSGKNIRSGEAMMSDKAVQITQAVFGKGVKDEEVLGKAVHRQYGKGEDGFHISSCQFAMHYFFETITTLQHFLRNLAECTKLGGYFIGTCYDGKEIFKLLREKKKGESIELYDTFGVKIWEVRKEYTSETFDDDSSSIGKQIDVYQESINKMFPEFLVNFDYLGRIMENYGFKLVEREEAQELGLPEACGSFEELFVLMNHELKTNKKMKNEYGSAFNMTNAEKKISFLNKYFVYKKVHQVIAEKVVLEQVEEEVEIRPKKEEEEEETIEVKIPSPSKKTKKTKVTTTTTKEPKRKSVLVKEKVKKLNKTILLVGDEEEVKAVEAEIVVEEPVSVPLVVPLPMPLVTKTRKPRKKQEIIVAPIPSTLEEVTIPLPNEPPLLKIKKVRAKKIT